MIASIGTILVYAVLGVAGVFGILCMILGALCFWYWPR